MHHQGTTPYTQRMVVAPTSNLAVPQTDGLTRGDVNGYFDACGNLKELGPDQPLAWDSRNQLQRTTQILRGGNDDDTEVYWYDGAGQRATKLGTARTSGTTRTERVRYLPGLELRDTEQTRAGEATPTPVERLQVLTLAAAGRQSVRVLHWEVGKPPTIENDQQRYSLDDQIGSSRLELDAHADVLTWEEYYPYGGTAMWSARSDTEAKYKYVRYSGQERDATGLYYYGMRYYAPWLSRWINPDPAGPVDGLNLFCMVGNNPISRKDATGLGIEKLFSRLRGQASSSTEGSGSKEIGYMQIGNARVPITQSPWENSLQIGDESRLTFQKGLVKTNQQQVSFRDPKVEIDFLDLYKKWNADTLYLERGVSSSHFSWNDISSKGEVKSEGDIDTPWQTMEGKGTRWLPTSPGSQSSLSVSIAIASANQTTTIREAISQRSDILMGAVLRFRAGKSSDLNINMLGSWEVLVQGPVLFPDFSVSHLVVSQAGEAPMALSLSSDRYFPSLSPAAPYLPPAQVENIEMQYKAQEFINRSEDLIKKMKDAGYFQ
nr:RHS repeat-associated core domain-containing protein [Burkholderia sp. GbtcB21]